MSHFKSRSATARCDKSRRGQWYSRPVTALQRCRNTQWGRLGENLGGARTRGAVRKLPPDCFPDPGGRGQIGSN